MNTLEKAIVTAIVDALIAAGYTLNIDNGGGGDEMELQEFSADRGRVLAALFACDTETLIVRKGPAGVKAPRSFVTFIYGNGNGGADVVSDCGGSLLALVDRATHTASARLGFPAVLR